MGLPPAFFRENPGNGLAGLLLDGPVGIDEVHFQGTRKGPPHGAFADPHEPDQVDVRLAVLSLLVHCARL